MNRMKMKWLLGALTAALAGVLILQWKRWPPPRAGQHPARVEAPNAHDDAPLDPLALLAPHDEQETYATIAERPLFRPNRRPPDPEDPNAGQQTPAPVSQTLLDQLDLNAVILAPGLALAWIQDPAQPRLRRVRIGDDLEGWSVQDILPDRLLLERQGERNTLILRDYAKATPPSPSRAATPQRPSPPRPGAVRGRSPAD